MLIFETLTDHLYFLKGRYNSDIEIQMDWVTGKDKKKSEYTFKHVDLFQNTIKLKVAIEGT